MTKELNNLILKQAGQLKFRVADLAPSTFQDLKSTAGLVIWSGESDKTIWNDATVNYAFRALHDSLHLKTGMGFSPVEEMELGRIQASQYDSQLMQDLVYIEVSGQAEHYLKTGRFVSDQIEFTKNALQILGYKI